MEQKKKTAITKNKILTAAEREFSEKGFAAARIENIANNAGVNKQMIYAHFKSKELLYVTVLENAYNRLNEYEEILKGYEFNGMQTIYDAVVKYFEFLMKDQAYVRLVLWENLNDAGYVGDIHTKLFAGIEELIKKGIEKGEVRADIDITQTAMSFNMFCFSAFSNLHTVSKLLHKDMGTREELEKRARHIAEVLTRYMQNN